MAQVPHVGAAQLVEHPRGWRCEAFQVLFWSTGLRNRERIRCREEVKRMARMHISSSQQGGQHPPVPVVESIELRSLCMYTSIREYKTDHDGFLEEAATTATTLISIPSDLLGVYSNPTELGYFRVGHLWHVILAVLLWLCTVFGVVERCQASLELRARESWPSSQTFSPTLFPRWDAENSPCYRSRHIPPI